MNDPGRYLSSDDLNALLAEARAKLAADEVDPMEVDPAFVRELVIAYIHQRDDAPSALRVDGEAVMRRWAKRWGIDLDRQAAPFGNLARLISEAVPRERGGGAT